MKAMSAYAGPKVSVLSVPCSCWSSMLFTYCDPVAVQINDWTPIHGSKVPLVTLDPFSPSALIKMDGERVAAAAEEI